MAGFKLAGFKLAGFKLAGFKLAGFDHEKNILDVESNKMEFRKDVTGGTYSMIKDLLLTTKYYEHKAIDYFPYTKIGKKISNATMEILQVPDKYFWVHIIKNKRSAKASLYGMIVLQGIAVLGIEYGLGLLANNQDMVYTGLYAHLGLDAVMVTLAPSWGRFKRW